MLYIQITAFNIKFTIVGSFKRLVFRSSIRMDEINLEKGSLRLGNGEKQSIFAAAKQESKQLKTARRKVL